MICWTLRGGCYCDIMDACSVRVHGLQAGCDLDAVRMYFEGRTSGGGGVKDVTASKDDSNAVYITFEEEDGTANSTSYFMK